MSDKQDQLQKAEDFIRTQYSGEDDSLATGYYTHSEVVSLLTRYAQGAEGKEAGQWIEEIRRYFEREIFDYNDVPGPLTPRGKQKLANAERLLSLIPAPSEPADRQGGLTEILINIVAEVVHNGLGGHSAIPPFVKKWMKENLPAAPSKEAQQSKAVNFMQVILNSHFWTDLKQILEWLKHPPEKPLEYLKQGIENSLLNGYNIRSLPAQPKQSGWVDELKNLRLQFQYEFPLNGDVIETFEYLNKFFEKFDKLVPAPPLIDNEAPKGDGTQREVMIFQQIGTAAPATPAQNLTSEQPGVRTIDTRKP